MVRYSVTVKSKKFGEYNVEFKNKERLDKYIKYIESRYPETVIKSIIEIEKKITLIDKLVVYIKDGKKRVGRVQDEVDKGLIRIHRYQSDKFLGWAPDIYEDIVSIQNICKELKDKKEEI